MRALGLTLTLLALIAATPLPASAYADPGSGAFLLQALYAAVIGGMFYFRKFLSRLTGRNNNDKK